VADSMLVAVDRPVSVVRWAALGVALLAAMAVAAFLIWAANPLGPSERALDAMRSDAKVRVTEYDGLYVFEPAWSDFMEPGDSVQATIGLVFYPGGRVDVRSYAPLCRAIAERGVFVVLKPMPLSLAVFAPRSGDDAIAPFPDVATWGVAGHSLGGAMAAQWFADGGTRLDGLALLGAWPPAGVDLSDSSAQFISVYGANDGGAAEIAASAPQLPPQTPFIRIEGGNHASFGDYGPQPGDGGATITRAEQQRIAADAIAAMLRRAGASRPQP